MESNFGATFSGPDLVELTRTLLAAASYARGLPSEMRDGFTPLPVAEDWEARMLEKDVDGLSVSWGASKRIARNRGTVVADFSDIPLEPWRILELVAPWSFELAVMPPIRAWMDDYFAPAISADHALLGWGMIVKGAGHEHSLVSRRWLEQGPWALYRGEHDTSFLQFHQLDADEPKNGLELDVVSLGQARASHDWLLSGFLRPKHRYQHDIRGVYSKEDGILRVLVNDREVSDAELTDACAARRDGGQDPDRPIRNIAYVFVERRAAEARLDALWLRGLECRTVEGGVEVRLDEGHQVARRLPPWVVELEARKERAAR